MMSVCTPPSAAAKSHASPSPTTVYMAHAIMSDAPRAAPDPAHRQGQARWPAMWRQGRGAPARSGRCMPSCTGSTVT